LIYTYDHDLERTGITGLLQSLAEVGLTLKDLHTKQSSLEEIFVRLVNAR
jgi:ABC-2 type transport system ATP-binding protein